VPNWGTAGLSNARRDKINIGDIAAVTVLCVQLKEMSHNNIKTFIGACVEPGHICYLMQMCSRGTVQVRDRVRVRKSFSTLLYVIYVTSEKKQIATVVLQL